MNSNHSSAPIAHHVASAKTLRKYVFGVILLIILAIVALVALKVSFAPKQQVDASKYQVVYLANGQAYFGKLQNTAGEYLVMKTPYTAQSVVPTTDKEKADQAQTTLLKVSAQVYGPDESIAIKSSQVAFWQNLRADSKVSQAIQAKQ